MRSSSLLEGAVDTAPPGVVASVSLLTVDGPTTSTAVHALLILMHLWPVGIAVAPWR